MDPGVVPDLTASDIALDTNHSCATTAGDDSGIACYGKGIEGELGTGETDEFEASPTPITTAPHPPWVALDAGGDDADLFEKDSTCAIGDDDTGSVALFCWGANADGRLGNGETTGPQATPVKIELPASPPTAVDAGPVNGCAIASGEAFCWGQHDGGQLGDGPTTDHAVAVSVCP